MYVLNGIMVDYQYGLIKWLIYHFVHIMKQWERLMKQFILTIMNYVTPYLAKNGGPIILAQIENEFNGNDQAYIDWCGSLVTNELSSTKFHG